MSSFQSKQQQQYNAATRAYLEMPRDKAIEQHPSLKAAFAAHDRLADTLMRNHPLNGDTRRDVDKLIRNTIAKDLLKGQEPKDTPKLHEAVKVHVAVRNLHTVDEALTKGPALAPKLPDEQRQLLVKHAEVAMKIDPRPAVERAGAYASPERFNAYNVAHALARIDAQDRNPFANPELQRVYKHEKAWGKHLEERGSGRAHDARGADRPAVDRGLGR